MDKKIGLITHSVIIGVGTTEGELTYYSDQPGLI
jgi:hypothetical protein